MTGAMRQRITDKLTKAFSPIHLDVIDESHHHIGHVGYREGGETHFKVVITAAAFKGQSRVAQHRAINAVLAEELAGPVHALSLVVKGESRP